GVTATDGAFLTGEAAWASRYVSWQSAGGLKSTVDAFVRGSANFLESMGISDAVAVPLMGVLVASFAGTTLDTACRLQRYVIQELSRALGRTAAGDVRRGARALSLLENRHGATLFAVILAGVLAALPGPGAETWSLATAGAGGQILWPMFGATNQLLGGLSFLVIAFWLWRRKLPVHFIVLPTVFLLVMPAWAMLLELRRWAGEGAPNVPLIVIAAGTLALEAWLIVEAILVWPRARGVMESALPPLPPRGVAIEAAGDRGRSC